MKSSIVVKADFDLSGQDDSHGTFEGYASRFGNIDNDNEVVVAGAFTDSIEAFKSEGHYPNIYYNHQHQDVPIGKLIDMEQREDGLYVKGQLLYQDVARAGEVYACLVNKMLRKMSIFALVQKGGYKIVDNVLHYTNLALKEVSLVGFPGNSLADVVSVKSETVQLDEVSKRLDLVENILFEIVRGLRDE